MSQERSLLLPPGSFGFPFIGETLSVILDPNFARKRHQKHGCIFKTHFLGSPTLFLYGAEAAQFILANENRYFVNNIPFTSASLLGSFSLASQTGVKHQNRRKSLYPAFYSSVLLEFVKTIEEITQIYCHKWVEMGALTWYPELQNYSFDLACKFLIGLDKASQTQLKALYETLNAGLLALPLRLPWSKFDKALRSRQQLLKEIEKIICQRQQQTDLGSDTLAILLQARDEEDNNLSLEELKDQVLGLLFAGHSTLTSALASFCLLMAQYPKILAQVRAEQEKLDLSEPITMHKLRQMTYLEQVLKEVLRLIPPVSGLFRKVVADCEFQGYLFPKGWNVIYQLPLTHQDESVYFNPEQFDSERFSIQRAEDKSKPFSYIPFGSGMRECLGKELARLEMKVFASLLVRNYKWELFPNLDLEMSMIPVPRPRDGLKVNFRLR